MTRNFTIGIRHHSISRARQIAYKGSLRGAKLAAAREFGDEQSDYVMVIYDDADDRAPVATRRVDGRRWHHFD